LKISIVPANFEVSNLASPTFSTKFFEKISKSELQNRIANNEVEIVDASRRIYRSTQKWRSNAAFRARTSHVSLSVSRSYQQVIASECSRRPMQEPA
jgi:hypothetical protein